jgi:hypothetical protein
MAIAAAKKQRVITVGFWAFNRVSKAGTKECLSQGRICYAKKCSFSNDTDSIVLLLQEQQAG